MFIELDLVEFIFVLPMEYIYILLNYFMFEMYKHIHYSSNKCGSGLLLMTIEN